MAWNTPASWAVGEVPTSAKMNAQVKDNLDVLSTHGHTTGAAGDGAQLTIPNPLHGVVFAR